MVAALWDLRVTGIDHIPRSGPTILVANHLSFIDSVFLMMAMPRRVLAAGKTEYMSSRKTRWLFPAAGMLPIDRSGGFAARPAMVACEEALARGEMLLIFPEGTRSRDGRLHAGHAGAAVLALRTGAPIIPIGIIGTERIQPPGASRPKCFLPCDIRIGDPIEIAKRGRAGRRAQADVIRDEFMRALADLSGPRRVPRSPKPVHPAHGSAPSHEASRSTQEAPLAAPPGLIETEIPVAEMARPPR